MTWSVGRESCCYVEQCEPLNGEQPFETEAEALRYAIECEVDAIGPLQRNLRSLRRRLKRLNR